MLHYFGENNEHNCGQCDVCLEKHTSGLKKGEYEDIASDIKNLLNRHPHTPQEVIHALSVPEEKILNVLTYLLSEERIKQENGKLYLMKT